MSTIPPVTPTSDASSAAASSAAATAALNSGTQLGESDFLNLLVTQLQNQDPMSPMDDAQFIAQLAQFSQLQETTTLNSTMSSFASLNQMTQSATLIGENVTTNATDSSGNPISGQVTGVGVSNGTLVLDIGTNSVPMADVTSINGTSSGSSS